MSERRLSLVALLFAGLALSGAASAAPTKQFQVTETSVVTDHVTIETSTPYPLVKSRLEKEVKRFDERFRTLLAENKIKQLRGKIADRLEPDGFLIHFVAQQGDWLALEGRRRQGDVYYLGDVLAAAHMTKQNFGAALYAPLRLNIYENAHGGTTFEYDKPSTQFGQFKNAEIDKVARSLDDHMRRLITKIST